MASLPSSSSSDCWLVTHDGQRFPVSITNLSERSPVFARLFQAGAPNESEFAIADVDSEALRKMLDVLSKASPLVECVWQVLPIARRFEDEDLLADCGQILLDSSADLGEQMLFADRYGLDDVRDQRMFSGGVEIITKMMEDLRASCHWEEYSDNFKTRLFDILLEKTKEGVELLKCARDRAQIRRDIFPAPAPALAPPTSVTIGYHQHQQQPVPVPMGYQQQPVPVPIGYQQQPVPIRYQGFQHQKPVSMVPVGYHVVYPTAAPWMVPPPPYHPPPPHYYPVPVLTQPLQQLPRFPVPALVPPTPEPIGDLVAVPAQQPAAPSPRLKLLLQELQESEYSMPNFDCDCPCCTGIPDSIDDSPPI